MKNEYESFDYDINKILNFCYSIDDEIEQLNYLKWIEKEYKLKSNKFRKEEIKKTQKRFQMSAMINGEDPYNYHTEISDKFLDDIKKKISVIEQYIKENQDNIKKSLIKDIEKNNELIETTDNFKNLQDKLELIPDVNEKLKILIEEKTDYLQQRGNNLLEDIWEVSYDKKIDLEIQKLEKILLIEHDKDLSNSNSENKLIYSSTNKILVISDSTDITRIFENAKQANIISNKTQITQIVDIFFNLKRSNYDKNKSDLNKPLPAKSGTETFFEFVKLCSSNLPTNKIDKLIDYLNQLDK